jgi:hypothetical protein
VSRLRLPDFRAFASIAPSPPPPPTPVEAVGLLLSRRQFLKAAGAATVVASLPWQRVERAWAARRGHFFTRTERRTLAPLLESIMPADADPGATKLGVLRYIERTLTAFDYRVPAIYAGGPFSGRRPFIDYDDGTPSKKRPRNDFKRFVEPNRLQSLDFRWQILGTSGLDASERALVAPLDAQRGGPLIGLIEHYRNGLAQLDALSRTEAGAPFYQLDATAQATVRNLARTRFPIDPRRGMNFIDIVVQHTIEGAFSAPEYGGNRRSLGWKLLRVEGDSQPLGYALYSRATDGFEPRPDQPLSSPNPDEVAAPLPISAEATAIQQLIVATSGIFEGSCS